MTAPTIVNTRPAFRLAILADVQKQAAEFLTPLDPDKPDGPEVISAGHLTEAIQRVKGSPLPAIDTGSAEVKTPADVYVDAICPECNLPTRIHVVLSAVLETTREAGSTIKLKAKAKGRSHVHNQLALDVDDGQEELGLEDVADPDDDEDLRPTGDVNVDELQGEAARSVAEAESKPARRLRSVPGRPGPAVDDADDALLPN